MAWLRFLVNGLPVIIIIMTTRVDEGEMALLVGVAVT